MLLLIMFYFNRSKFPDQWAQEAHLNTNLKRERVHVLTKAVWLMREFYNSTSSKNKVLSALGINTVRTVHVRRALRHNWSDTNAD